MRRATAHKPLSAVASNGSGRKKAENGIGKCSKVWCIKTPRTSCYVHFISCTNVALIIFYIVLFHLPTSYKCTYPETSLSMRDAAKQYNCRSSPVGSYSDWYLIYLAAPLATYTKHQHRKNKNGNSITYFEAHQNHNNTLAWCMWNCVKLTGCLLAVFSLSHHCFLLVSISNQHQFVSFEFW